MDYKTANLHINNRAVIRYRRGLTEHYLDCHIEHVDETYLIANVNTDHIKIDLSHIYEIKDYSYFEEMVI